MKFYAGRRRGLPEASTVIWLGKERTGWENGAPRECLGSPDKPTQTKQEQHEAGSWEVMAQVLHRDPQKHGCMNSIE